MRLTIIIKRLIAAAGENDNVLPLETLFDMLPEARSDSALLASVLEELQASGVSLEEEGIEEEDMLDEESELDDLAVEDDEPVASAAPARPGRKRLDLNRIPLNDFLGLYMQETTRQNRLLSAEEEVQLAKEIEAGLEAARCLEEQEMSRQEREELEQIKEKGRAARSRMVRANTRLVISIAKRYRGQGLDFIDLIQEGNLGLLTAVDKYDYRRGNRFSTYATWWIRQGITRALANQGRIIRLPAHLTTRLRELYRVMQELEQRYDRPATVEEIADYLDVTPERVRWLQQISRPLLYLEQQAGDDPEAELGDFIEDTSAPQPTETVAQKMLGEQINEILNQLTPREAYILRLRYGLQGYKPHTLKEIGEIFDLSRERIRQLEKDLLQRLRLPGMAEHLSAYLN